MSENYQNQYIEEDEITLKELILKIKEFITEVWDAKWLIPVFILPVLAYMSYKALKTTPTYEAPLTFMINEDEGGSLGGIAGLLGQFGLGGGGGGSEYNLDKILELMKSHKITQNVLLKKVNIHGQSDYLANHVINNLDTLGQWYPVSFYKRPFTDMEKVEAVRSFRFTSDTLSFNNILENRIIKAVYSQLVGSPADRSKAILSSGYEENTAIMNITSRAFDEELSLALTDGFFEELSEYYIDKSIEKQKATFDLVRFKHDSLLTELRTVEYRLADFNDRNRNVISQKESIEQVRLRNSIIYLSAGLAKAKENMEIADFALQTKTPFIQVIDRPFMPLSRSKPSLFRTFVMATFLGAFLAIGFIVARKIYRDAMQ